LIPGVNSDGRVGVKMDKTALEPRLGVAWKPFGSTKTAIRAGYAIFHDSSWNQGGQGLWENPPFFAESFFGAFFPNLCPSAHIPGQTSAPSFCAAQNLDVTGKSVSEGFPLLTQPTDPSTFGGNLQSQNLDFKLGRIQQYNLNIERQLPGNVVLTAGYAGSKSTHILVGGYNLNVNSPTACDTVPGYTLGCGLGPAPRYSQFGTIANISDTGKARYDSFQIKAETKSLAQGLYALIGYTYSKALDNGFSDGIGTSTGAAYFPLPGTSRLDWGLSQIDLKHNFTASITYELPFGRGKQFGNDWSGPLNAAVGGWELDVIEKITSGFPLFLISSSNGSGVNFANGFNRPNQLCNGRLDNHSINQFFNTECFQDPPLGELGNASRTPLYGPGFVNTDFSAIKHFRLTEATNLDFRAEFFNLFNHPQFFTPGQDVDSSDFGIITRTVNNPRLIQFALKLNF
jgi:hypothetical protein